MQIAIIGNGNIGGGLGKAWAAKGHSITFGARDPADAELAALCRTIGAKALPVASAVAGSTVIVFAMPWKALDDVLAATGDLAGKVVIDCTNAVAPGFAGLVYGHTTSAAEELAKKLPKARVFKSFNAQGAENLANPVYGGVRAANFFCGDDGDGKRVVKTLVEDVGFEAVDVGPLKNARLLEPLMLLWVASSQALGTRDLAFKLLRR
jgi:predicted dinucleotide-binding enzyme